MTSAADLFAREQEEHAAQMIEAGLLAARRSGGSIDTGTARIIAATLHAGRSTALERFAAVGTLDVAKALPELEGQVTDLHHVAWVSALWDYFERADSKEVM